MKKLRLLPLVCLLLSCASHKTKQQEIGYSLDRRQVVETAINGQLFTQYQTDSNHSSWQFYTFEPFFFHPDSGLRGNQGFLGVENLTFSRAKTAEHEYNIQLESRDSLSARQKEISNEVKTNPSKSISFLLWAGIGLGCAFFLFRRR